MNEINNIVEFSTSKSKYLFDTVSGEVLLSEQWTTNIIKDFYNLSETEMIEAYSINKNEVKTFKQRYAYIDKLIALGMFYTREEVQADNDLKKLVLK